VKLGKGEYNYETNLMAASALALFLPSYQSATAADMPSGPSYTLPSVVAPIYNWTGCYVGANLGASWGRADISGSGGDASGSNTGFAGGGQVGCDYQSGAWVVGIRNLIHWTSLDSTGTLPAAPRSGYTFSGSAHWFDTLTARGGYLVQPNVLLYIQGGFAWTENGHTISTPTGVGVAQISNNTTGWTVGGGGSRRIGRRSSNITSWTSERVARLGQVAVVRAASTSEQTSKRC
jgi:outer membrane immunogenic protein